MANSTGSVDSYDAITALNSLNSPLLRLPAELRNKIYLYVATEDTYRLKSTYHLQNSFSLEKGHVHRVAPKYEGRIPQWIGPITASRQLRSEVGLLPYMINSFHTTKLDHFDTLSATLKMLHKPIETLHLQVEMTQAHNWSQRIRRRSNLALNLPSLRKGVLYGIVDEEYFFSVLLRRFPYETEERIMWMRQMMRDWLRGDDDERLEVVFVEGEMRDTLDLLKGDDYMKGRIWVF